MKPKRLSVAFIIPLLYAAPALAGEHRDMKDDFTETTTSVYGSTVLEYKLEGVMFALRDYRPSEGTVFLLVSPARGATACDDNYLLLKSADGEIHKIDATEKAPDMCFARIPSKWVKDHFMVRIPMWSGDSKDAAFSTTSLDLSRIAE